MNKVEVGVVNAHPLVMMYKQILTIFRSWMYARKYGIDYRAWYGVYVSNTETVIAHMGCSEYARVNAQKLTDLINNEPCPSP